MTHPTYTARDIASLIDNDPIMASQIKEFIQNDRLIELLCLELPEPPPQPEPDIDDFSDDDLLAEVRFRALMADVLEEASSEMLIDELKTRIKY